MKPTRPERRSGILQNRTEGRGVRGIPTVTVRFVGWARVYLLTLHIKRSLHLLESSWGWCRIQVLIVSALQALRADEQDWSDLHYNFPSCLQLGLISCLGIYCPISYISYISQMLQGFDK